MDDGAQIGRPAVISIHRLIGERIRLSRMLADITREELAERLNDRLGFPGFFNWREVAVWESGAVIISPAIVVEIAHALGVPLSFLFTNVHDKA